MTDKTIEQAVILAGGKASRLSEYIGDTPKFLVPLGASSLADFSFKCIEKSGIPRVLLLLGHKSESIIEFVEENKNRYELEIDYLIESSPMGTGGALLNALSKEKIDEFFLLMHGDLFIDFNISRMMHHFQSGPYDACLVVHPTNHMHDSDLVEIDEHHSVIEFHCKPHREIPRIRNLGNAGIYMLQSKDFRVSPGKPMNDLDRDLIPKMLHNGVSFGAFYDYGLVKDIGTPYRLESIRKLVSDRNFGQTRALFIDRDGTLNVEKGYITRSEDISLYKDAIELIKFCNNSHIRVLVVSNQPVLARGEASWQDLENINIRIDQLLSEHHAYIDKFYYCPHHPDQGYRGEIKHLKITCNCRKPEPGLIVNAISDFGLDLEKCIMVGDSWRDYELGLRMGIDTYLVDRSMDAKEAHVPTVNSLTELIALMKE